MVQVSSRGITRQVSCFSAPDPTLGFGHGPGTSVSTRMRILPFDFPRTKIPFGIFDLFLLSGRLSHSLILQLYTFGFIVLEKSHL
jgi:hypothetical protein